MRDHEPEGIVDQRGEAYVTPALVIRGSIEALTRGGQGNSPDIGAAGSQFPP